MLRVNLIHPDESGDTSDGQRSIDLLANSLLELLVQRKTLVCSKEEVFPESAITAAINQISQKSLDRYVYLKERPHYMKIFPFHIDEQRITNLGNEEFATQFISELSEFMGKIPEYMEDTIIKKLHRTLMRGDTTPVYSPHERFTYTLAKFLEENFRNPPHWANCERFEKQRRYNIPLLVPIFNFQFPKPVSTDQLEREAQALHSYLKKKEQRRGPGTGDLILINDQAQVTEDELKIVEKYGAMVGFIFDLLYSREFTLGEKPHQIVAAPLEITKAIPAKGYIGDNWVRAWANSGVVSREFSVSHCAYKI